MATQILRSAHSQSHIGSYNIVSREKPSEDVFILQQRKLRARQEAEETQPLVDEEDDEVQKLLASEIQGSLTLDEFVAHTNVAPPAKESIPSQVEAVYRDINSMIDTFGLNLRSVKAFTKGHSENAKDGGRTEEDLENPDDWVISEVDALAEVLDEDLYASLEEGRVRNLEDKREACQDLVREMHRLRAKQEDLKRIIMVRKDPDQVEAVRSLPLSAEQAAQQNELRGEFMNFTNLLAEAEQETPTCRRWRPLCGRLTR
jgi:nucleoporin NUP159